MLWKPKQNFLTPTVSIPESSGSHQKRFLKSVSPLHLIPGVFVSHPLETAQTVPACIYVFILISVCSFILFVGAFYTDEEWKSHGLYLSLSDFTHWVEFLYFKKVGWANGRSGHTGRKLKGPNHSLSLGKCHPTRWDFQGRELEDPTKWSFYLLGVPLFVVTFEEPSSALLWGQMHKHSGAKVFHLSVPAVTESTEVFQLPNPQLRPETLAFLNSYSLYLAAKGFTSSPWEVL